MRSVSMRRSHRAKFNGNGLFYSAGVLSVSASRTIEIDVFKMPTNCCVLLCTRKDKRDEDTGEIIHFFRFPDDENTRNNSGFALYEEMLVHIFRLLMAQEFAPDI